MKRQHLYERAQRRVDLTARRMVTALLTDVPFYQQLPPEQLEGEMLEICRDNLRLFFASLLEHRVPTQEELNRPSLSAARQAQARVPLEVVLTAYHVGGQLSWAELVNEAEPDETAELLDAAHRLQIYVQTVTGTVAAAYLQERQDMFGEERGLGRSLASALLSGDPAHALAARLDVNLDQAWSVLALRFAERPDETSPGPAASLATRRKLCRVQSRLEKVSGGPVIGLLGSTGGPVFLPTSAVAGQDWQGLVQALQSAVGVPVLAALCGDEGVGLTEASQCALDVLDLVSRLGYPPGLYTLEDVLFEYQMTRPGRASGGLKMLVDAVAHQPDLFLTLETYLAANAQRGIAASRLHVHVNTVDYRLKRIATLTGHDPTTTSGLQLLAAAMIVRRWSL